MGAVKHMQDDDIDFGALVNRLWERRIWLIACVLLLSLIFTFAAFILSPIYRSTVLLAPAASDSNSLSGALSSAIGQIGGLASLAGIDVNGKDMKVEESLAVLKSRQFLEKFISDNNLLPMLFPKKWDAERNGWKVDDTPTLGAGYKFFSEKVLSAAQDKKTGLVSVSIDWSDAVESADWANEIVRRLNVEMRDRAIQKSSNAIELLQKELPKIPDISTQAAVSRLIEAQVKQKMLASVSEEYALRIVNTAVPAERDQPVWPKKILLIPLGPFIGLVIGVLTIMAEWMFAEMRKMIRR